MSPAKLKRGGRVAARIAEGLKSQIRAGELEIGQYLPGVRDVGREHNVSPETARRAMKIMEAENWVRVHPGHGFKVTAKGNDPASAAPVAFILSGLLSDGQWTPLGRQLLAAMYGAAESRGWSLLGVSARGRKVGDVVEELKTARVSGFLIDTPNKKLTRTLTGIGVPTVLVEEFSPGLDSVTQDNFGGAFRAAQYLVEGGHRRLGWFGAMAPTIQSYERWAGAQAAVRDSKATIVSEGSVSAEVGENAERVRTILSGPERPTGLLALWWTAAVTAARVACELGLEPGRDIEIVSWCPREQLAEFRAAYPCAELPATMVWSIQELGGAALARLAERRERPEAAAVRVSVGVELLAGARQAQPDTSQEA
jgi:DNA-binding LacI/PurR family transcriptional regulator